MHSYIKTFLSSVTSLHCHSRREFTLTTQHAASCSTVPPFIALTLQNSSSSSRNGVRKSEGMICSNVLTWVKELGRLVQTLEDVLGVRTEGGESGPGVTWDRRKRGERWRSARVYVRETGSWVGELCDLRRKVPRPSVGICLNSRGNPPLHPPLPVFLRGQGRDYVCVCALM